jgi:hypothetical protein
MLTGCGEKMMMRKTTVTRRYFRFTKKLKRIAVYLCN